MEETAMAQMKTQYLVPLKNVQVSVRTFDLKVFNIFLNKYYKM